METMSFRLSFASSRPLRIQKSQTLREVNNSRDSQSSFSKPASRTALRSVRISTDAV